MALEAHSAGGLTAGALLNRRPGAIGAALLEAPFVDVLSAMCQQELPLTVHEYEEWGDPSVSSQFEQVWQVGWWRSGLCMVRALVAGGIAACVRMLWSC